MSVLGNASDDRTIPLGPFSDPIFNIQIKLCLKNPIVLVILLLEPDSNIYQFDSSHINVNTQKRN